MSIDIHRTKQADFIQFTHPKAGYKSDQESCQRRLLLNNRYQVERIVVDDWRTNVWLYDFPGIMFNSVMFDNVGEQK